jgi:hypothetical protein
LWYSWLANLLVTSLDVLMIAQFEVAEIQDLTPNLVVPRVILTMKPEHNMGLNEDLREILKFGRRSGINCPGIGAGRVSS